MSLMLTPSRLPQTSLSFRGHLITNFPHVMVLLIIKIFEISDQGPILFL